MSAPRELHVDGVPVRVVPIDVEGLPDFAAVTVAPTTLESVCMLLEEILAELKRANSSQREGAISSVEVKTSTRGVDIACKSYVGSDIEAAGDAAAAEYQRVRAMLEQRLMGGAAGG